jgi:DNA-binding transcriptional MerR regulator
MTQNTYTIGEIAKRCHISPRRVRFYADAGILPPVARTDSGYRVFSDADIVRLDLICTLRNAGASLEDIKAVLRQELSLADLMTLRLGEMEAQIKTQRKIAATLRMALQSPSPSLDELKEVNAMIAMSKDDRRFRAQAFMDAVTEGVVFDPDWKGAMIDMITPDMASEPLPEQVEALLELNSLLGDGQLVETLRAQAIDTGLTAQLLRVRDQREEYLLRYNQLMGKVSVSIQQGATPLSAEGQARADEFIDFLAWNRGVTNTAAFRQRMWGLWKHNDTIRRFWEVVAILRKEPLYRRHENDWIEEAAIERLRLVA